MTYFINSSGPVRPTFDCVTLKNGINFGAFLASSDYSYGEIKKIEAEQKRINGEFLDGEPSYTHQRVEYHNPISWLLLFGMMHYGGFGFFFLAILTDVIFLFLDNSLGPFFSVDTLILYGGLLIFGFSGRALAYSRFGKLRLMADANREDGQIWSFLKSSSSPIKRPFAEFQGYRNTYLRKSGQKDYDLWVCHHTERLWFRLGLHHTNNDKVYMEWEFLQAYMDKSSPMPDIPVLEPYRKLDSVTAAWDKKHGRPEFLFRNMPEKTYERLRDYAWDYLKGFSWGWTRRHAIDEGWTPPPEKFWSLVPEAALTDENELGPYLKKKPGVRRPDIRQRKPSQASLKHRRELEKRQKNPPTNV